MEGKSNMTIVCFGLLFLLLMPVVTKNRMSVSMYSNHGGHRVPSGTVIIVPEYNYCPPGWKYLFNFYRGLQANAISKPEWLTATCHITPDLCSVCQKE